MSKSATGENGFRRERSLSEQSKVFHCELSLAMLPELTTPLISRRFSLSLRMVCALGGLATRFVYALGVWSGDTHLRLPGQLGENYVEERPTRAEPPFLPRSAWGETVVIWKRLGDGPNRAIIAPSMGDIDIDDDNAHDTNTHCKWLRLRPPHPRWRAATPSPTTASLQPSPTISAKTTPPSGSWRARSGPIHRSFKLQF